ncbi:polysaccharide deacetylase family protein [Roseococcus sp. SYP-B2431]|uniref:polysaccharide deacetylase family protein n=1 Tax=Roseococcus sp. SYP-B2431 TaxID=2496640 RepID=UPI00103E11C3|nr:polysaccharide deacetylase family protein [Roseococcus sp. SYP-B2431]TCH99809.1 polysaccharide deacetylase family protein [Roseococcus sp. SYP-B2431]
MPTRRALGLAALALPTAAAGQPASPRLARACAGTVYLTIDTGWAREAETIAAAMARHGIVATLFVAHEPTFRGDRSLDPGWGPFWRARAAEGHAFASHTWRHWYFRGDAGPGRTSYLSNRGEGREVLDGPALCAELARPVEALRALAPQARILPLWRAPGGIVTPGALRMAEACGLRHQGWTAQGFLGDELDSAASPNAALLRRNLARIRDGEVLVMHWGVRSRREPFGLIFEALVTGLLDRGFCFATLPAQGKT